MKYYIVWDTLDYQAEADDEWMLEKNCTGIVSVSYDQSQILEVADTKGGDKKQNDKSNAMVWARIRKVQEEQRPREIVDACDLAVSQNITCSG